MPLAAAVPGDKQSGKRPIHNAWTERVYSDADFASHSGNVGVHGGTELEGGGYLAIVDVDNGTDKNGATHWNELQAQHGQAPRTLTVESGSGNGSMHLYFRSEQPLGNKTRLAGCDIDIKAHLGQVVAPHSVHYTGGVYKVLEDCAIAEIPSWIVEMIGAPKRATIAQQTELVGTYKRTATRKIAACWTQWQEEAAGEGGSNSAAQVLYQAAGYLHLLADADRDEWHQTLLAADHEWSGHSDPNNLRRNIQDAVTRGIANPILPPVDEEERASYEAFYARLTEGGHNFTQIKRDHTYWVSDQEIGTWIWGASACVSVTELAKREPTGVYADVLNREEWERAYRLRLDREPKAELALPPGSIGRWGVPADLTAKSGPTKWLCEGLRLCATGRPNLIVGRAGSGKTMIAQATLLAIAADKPALGCLPVASGSVIHLDHEQGLDTTRARYQQLAEGMGVNLADIGDRLRVFAHPPVRLSDADAEEQYMELVQTFAPSVVLIDSLRAAAGGIDENDSAMRELLDILSRVTERTGTAFWVVHHSGKGEGEGAAIRGASAIQDASGEVTQIVASRSGGLEVRCVTARHRGAAAGQKLLNVSIVDSSMTAASAGEPPIRVIAMKPAAAEARDKSPRERILDVLRENPGMVQSKVIKTVGGRAKDVLTEIEQLVADQVIQAQVVPSTRAKILHVIGA